MNLKSIIVKSDVFHLVSGVWKTPAERCLMWIGGFRPLELIKVYTKTPFKFIITNILHKPNNEANKIIL